MVARQIGSSKSGAATGAGRLLPAAYRKPRKGEFRQPSAASTARAGGLKVLSARASGPCFARQDSAQASQGRVCRPRRRCGSSCTILRLRGAFFMGSSIPYRSRAMRLSYRCSTEVLVPDHRLAPEHPYPAAFDDALGAWQLVKRDRPDTPLSFLLLVGQDELLLDDALRVHSAATSLVGVL